VEGAGGRNGESRIAGDKIGEERARLSAVECGFSWDGGLPGKT